MAAWSAIPIANACEESFVALVGSLVLSSVGEYAFYIASFPLARRRASVAQSDKPAQSSVVVPAALLERRRSVLRRSTQHVVVCVDCVAIHRSEDLADRGARLGCVGCVVDAVMVAVASAVDVLVVGRCCHLILRNRMPC